LLWPKALEQIGLGLAVSAAASAVNLVVALVLWRAGKQHRSVTLEANASHLFTDVWTSAGVIAGVGAVAATGWQRLDPLSRCWSPPTSCDRMRIVRKSVLGLMDTALPPAEMEAVKRASTPRRGRRRVPRAAVAAIRARRFVSLHVLVPGAWTVHRGHQLLEDIEADIRGALPNATVLTHLESLDDPRSWDDVALDRADVSAPDAVTRQ